MARGARTNATRRTGGVGVPLPFIHSLARPLFLSFLSLSSYSSSSSSIFPSTLHPSSILHPPSSITWLIILENVMSPNFIHTPYPSFSSSTASCPWIRKVDPNPADPMMKFFLLSSKRVPSPPCTHASASYSTNYLRVWLSRLGVSCSGEISRVCTHHRLRGGVRRTHKKRFELWLALRKADKQVTVLGHRPDLILRLTKKEKAYGWRKDDDRDRWRRLICLTPASTAEARKVLADNDCLWSWDKDGQDMFVTFYKRSVVSQSGGDRC